MIVAIDGPAASGKSTVARGVAKRLGFDYLDTGAMYRALTWKVLKERVDTSSERAIASLARSGSVEFERNGDVDHKKVFVEGRDVSKEIRSPKVSGVVSAVSKIPTVRKVMVKEQRSFAKNRDVVVEGRDTGSVVFPEAEVKIYLTASRRERARRRHLELLEKGHKVSMNALEREIIARDQTDSTRGSSPLYRAADAHQVDTTGKKVEEVVEEIISKYVKDKLRLPKH